MRNKTLITIIGPTAIGKTAIAIKVAKHFDTEIISCDSRQFYREMSIGTAVPSSQELAEAKHHFIHHKSIKDNYSVGDFEEDAILFINRFFENHDALVMVGGSGLYEKAVTEGLDKFPDVPKEIRAELNKEYEENGLESLQAELKVKDEEYYQEADLQNHKRLIRALEIIRHTGKKFSDFRKNKPQKRNFNIIKIGLELPRDVVYNRINERVDIMIKNGLLKEVESLLPYKNLNALQTVGYKELFPYFEEQADLDFCIQEVKKNTRRFAKRQLTWYRKDEKVNWFSPKQADEIIRHLGNKLNA